MRGLVPVLVVLAAAPALAADSWVEVRGPAFSVVSDGGEKEARRVLSQFEQVRAALKEAWPWARLDPSRPVTILALRDEDDFRRLLPASGDPRGGLDPYGAFLPAPDRNWAAVRLDVTRFREDDETWENPYHGVFHDYIHLVLEQNFEQLPPWLEEGLAEFWGNTIVDGDRVFVGRFITSHVWTLRERTLTPLSRLLATAQGSTAYSERDRATVFFAQSWALVHYLTLGSETRQGQLGRLMDALRAGKKASDATAEAFGDLAALDKELESYARRGVFPARRRTAIVDPRPIVNRELPPAETLALRAAFLSAAGREAEASSAAAEALRADPGFVGAYEAKAIVALRAQRRDEARQALEKAVAMPGASDFAHEQYARLLWESLKGRAGLERVEAELQRAVEINTWFARAYEGLALVKEARGAPLDQAIQLALRASVLEPGNLDLRISALRLTAHSGQVQAARAQAERLLGFAVGEDRRKVEAFVAEISDPKRLPPDAGCAIGYGPACGILGAQYRDGTGVAKDAVKAFAYFQKGCTAGHAESCSSQGWAYEDGSGVAKDLPRAIPLYRRACDGGDRWACTRLGFALASGDGTSPDPAEAVRLLERSCAAEDNMACAKLGSMLRVGEGVPADVRRAESLLRAACTKGSSWGCGELASLLVARGTSQDLEEAARLFEKACETDAPSFCAMLAGLLELGKGVARDEARAAALYRKACERGYAPACGKGGASGR